MKFQTALAAALVAVSTTAFAADDKHRQLDAHEHGQSELSIAIEGKKVVMELEAPGADIVGFEHRAKTKKQRRALSAAKKALRKISNVLTWPKEAGCTLKKAKVGYHVEGGDDHGHDHGHKRKHKKPKKKKHSHGHGHAHGKKKEKEAESTHAEFHAEYSLTCKSPAKLTAFEFPFFKKFKRAEELDVSIAGPKSQKKFEVERGATKISLEGLM